MDNQQIERINILAEKAFHKNISPDELREYLHLVEECELKDDLIFLDKPKPYDQLINDT